MNAMYLIIPMSGQGNRFKSKGYSKPKPLIEVSGIPMIERLLENFPTTWKAVFVLAENHQDTLLEPTLKKLRPDAIILYIPPHQSGPSYAVQKALEVIPPNSPVLVSYCDYGLIWNPQQFQKYVAETDCDACLVSYRGFHPHYLNPTTYAFSKIENGRVVEVREKGSFTDNRENEFASAGAYYFKNSSELIQVIDAQIKKNIQLNGEFYTSLTVQTMIQMNPRALVNIFEISFFFQWGTPEDLVYFEYWEKNFKNYNRFSRWVSNVSQILMPMAGAGSRFKELTATPKPLICFGGKPMYQWALSSLPQAQKVCFVVSESFKAEVESLEKGPGRKVISVEGLTDGQAITTQIGLAGIKPNQEVIVSSCDHAVVLDPLRWQDFQKEKSFDAAIFVIKEFPGVLRSPDSYAYVQAEKNEALFPEVISVSVKKPISSTPLKDALLVGTFWFRDASILDQGIKQLIEKKRRVRNEFYLDSIFEELILSGLKVVTIELDGYMNFGDPQSLSEVLYWHECFAGFKLSPRRALQGVVEC